MAGGSGPSAIARAPGAAAKRAACQTCRGLISPKRRCGDRPDASPAMIGAAGPLRSTSDAPTALRLVCRARSDGASHQRAAPPSGRAGASSAQRVARFVKDVKTDHRRARLRRDMQGRMIAEAEIVAKPDDAGGSGMAGHQMGQRAWHTLGPRTDRTLQLSRA